MPAFAGAASGLAATSCCAGERLATRLSTAPPRRRSAGRAAVSLREQRWRGCAHTGLLTMAGACVHEGAGLLGGGAGGECENGDNAEHLSEVAAGTEGGGATKRGEINKKAGPGCRRGGTHSLRVEEGPRLRLPQVYQKLTPAQ